MRLNEKESLNNLTGDTMVVQISDNSGSVKEKIIFNYGLHDTIENEFNGEYFIMKKLEINANYSAIDISIIFKRKSNLHFLEIFLISSPSKQIHRQMLKNLNLANKIYRNMINLLSPSIIDLSLISNDGNDENWKIGDIVTATCRAYDGIPIEIPMFANYQTLSVLQSSFSREQNQRTIKFKVRLSDHLTKIKCFAGNVYKYIVLKVLHLPTKLYIQPNISTAVQLDTKILCFVRDGYPNPLVEWIYLDGPMNSSQFYEINTNRSELYINTKCPIKSKWKFECKAVYDFGDIRKRMESIIISFVVTDSKPLIFNKNDDEFRDRITNLENLIKNINDSYQKEKLDSLRVQENLFNEIKKMERKCKCIRQSVNENRSNGNNENLEEFQNNIKSEIAQINLIIKNVNNTNHYQLYSIKNFQKSQFDLLNEIIGNLKNDINGLKQNKNQEMLKIKRKLENVENIIKNGISNNKNDSAKCKSPPSEGEINTKGHNSQINEWIIQNFQILKKINEEIFSPLFYSFTSGYRMRLNLIPEGQNSNDNTFISLFFQILPGEFDNEIMWPMKSEIKLSIKNQKTENLLFETKFSLKINSNYSFVFHKPQCNGSEFLGIPSYASLNSLENNELLYNDVVVIVCEVIKN